jgi:uncharacterized protein (DUF58 family)
MILDAAVRARLERMALSSRRRVRGRFAGRHRSTRYGESLDFADYRPYVTGDDYRRIDHQLRARLGVTLIRLFESEDELPVRIVLDVSASMGFERKERTAKELVAALTFLTLAGGDRVVPFAIPGREGRPYQQGPTGRHMAAWPEIEAWIESLVPGGQTPLPDVVGHLLRTSSMRGPVVVVSDLMTPGWSSAIDALGVASGGLVVHVLGPSEIDPIVSGDVRLIDAETGADVDVSTDQVTISGYHQRVDEFLDEARRRSHRVELDYVLVPATDSALDDTMAALTQMGVLV